ncbi:MAG: ATP-binding cassette domain-containing protein [Candidatus Zixiibacteriota bacterium]
MNCLVDIPILEVSSLTRTVVIEQQPKNIIKDFSYAFYKKKIYTVIGPSGAGKSSLLRLLNRLDEPTSGEIIFHNRSYGDYAPCELRRKIGYLFQTPYLFKGTVRDNLLYANKSLNKDDIEHLTCEVKLKPEQINRPVTNLSVGEMQRVALARLLATSPEIILLDEPTSALDPGNQEAIEKLIQEIVVNEKLTAIVVTHHPDQALRIGQDAILMVDGKIVESGIVEQVINHPQSISGKLYKARQLK